MDKPQFQDMFHKQQAVAFQQQFTDNSRINLSVITIQLSKILTLLLNKWSSMLLKLQNLVKHITLSQMKLKEMCVGDKVQ